MYSLHFHTFSVTPGIEKPKYSKPSCLKARFAFCHMSGESTHGPDHKLCNLK